MGAVHAARVDHAALIGIAGRYEAAAELVDGAVRTQLASLRFDGSVAGRAYSASGDALRDAVERVVGSLSDWSQSATAIAATLRRTAEQYAEADARAAWRLL
ncbi:ESX-1 secretion-associated protein [Mycolicibacterium sp. S2-37]|uniref:type VII secretion target n=1 Tax=Mycolicibacterium sp. S2-37 TaxID=2810297 RepID=UPI001A944CF4|nr:type VII secretion target [Mycolicibacterium sp. S2-37]MBO0678844.1 ESX-1 secretion-associated protein [Mycolicibacterium sp. S2-37]